MNRIPHNKPTLGEEEARAAAKVVRSGFVAQGSEVELFEKEFCRFLGLTPGHAVAVSSGTAALFLALWGLKASGKKVSFPVYTCSSLRNAVRMAGASEVLLDISEGSPNLDARKVSGCGSDIAIVPHMYGLPVDISTLRSPVIEDCAQALGSYVGDTPAGLQGEVGIYSFYATKLITTGGQGGMLVSRNKTLVDSIRDYREFDYRRDQRIRFNFQMTDLQAAIGRVQLRKLPVFLLRRSQIFEKYRADGLDLLDITCYNRKKVAPVRFRAVIRTKSPRKFLASMSKKGITGIVPIRDWELLGTPKLFPNAYRLTQETVSLPIYPILTDEDVNSIISTVNNAIG